MRTTPIPRFSPVPTRRIGYVLGFAAAIGAVSLADRAWRDWTKGAWRSERPVEAHGERRGRVHVADGDSIAIGDTRLRLVGIDAPELAQTCLADDRPFACGEAAKARLVALIEGRPVECAWSRLDKYGRGLATCRVGAVDLGATMVREGWAVAYGGHEAEEAEARRNRRGLWAMRFEWPEDFRRRSRGHGFIGVEER